MRHAALVLLLAVCVVAQDTRQHADYHTHTLSVEHGGLLTSHGRDEFTFALVTLPEFAAVRANRSEPASAVHDLSEPGVYPEDEDEEVDHERDVQDVRLVCRRGEVELSGEDGLVLVEDWRRAGFPFTLLEAAGLAQAHQSAVLLKAISITESHKQDTKDPKQFHVVPHVETKVNRLSPRELDSCVLHTAEAELPLASRPARPSSPVNAGALMSEAKSRVYDELVKSKAEVDMKDMAATSLSYTTLAELASRAEADSRWQMDGSVEGVVQGLISAIASKVGQMQGKMLTNAIGTVLGQIATASVTDVMVSRLVGNVDLYLANGIPPALTEALRGSLEDAVPIDIGDFIASKHLAEEIARRVEPHVTASLTRAVPPLVLSGVPEAIALDSLVPFVHTLSRSLTHSLVPSITATITHSAAQDVLCSECYNNKRPEYCAQCHYVSVKVYYSQYYAGYFTTHEADYYAQYYFDYYRNMFFGRGSGSIHDVSEEDNADRPAGQWPRETLDNGQSGLSPMVDASIVAKGAKAGMAL